MEARAVMGVAIALAVLFVLVMVAAWRVGAVRNRRDPLWHCPICAADAVSALERDAVDDVLAKLEVRCGDCGTWRRLVTTRGSARLLELSLERHSRRDAQARRPPRARSDPG